MQHHVSFGYPTPPASPSAYDNLRCQPPQQMLNSRPQQPFRYVPLAPEERLGTCLEGKLQLIDILGTGAYGVVYSAVDITTGVRYAVKCLSKFNSDGTPLERRQAAYQQREIHLHYLASAHENIVSMYKIVDHADCVFVILEFCPEGDLFLNITERGQYVGNDELAKKIFLQILDAVDHCHKLGIYHRDLKPENILCTGQGDTVKLADFGLATSDDRSEDYGCGSTFYMSPECLDQSSRRPYYMCAPNDVWSLGVVLVNLTCGRNPWKQASAQDSTYRAYARSPDFLKSILPITDDLNQILGRIFNPIPEQRITVPELREMIQACPRLTGHGQQQQVATPPSPPTSPGHIGHFIPPSAAAAACYEEAIIDDSEDSDCESVSTMSDDASLTTSGSTISDLDDEFLQEQQDAVHHHHQHHHNQYTYEHESVVIREQQQQQQQQLPFYQGQEFVSQQYTGPVPANNPFYHHNTRPHMAPMPAPPPPVQPQCQQPRGYFPLWHMVKYVQQGPLRQTAAPFHHQLPVMPSFQGCY